MVINEIEYLDKDIRRWKQLSANLQFAISKGWIPILLDLEVEPELIEAGYPNFEGKEVECVECPLCEKQYKFNQVTWFRDHKMMRCPGKEE